VTPSGSASSLYVEDSGIAGFGAAIVQHAIQAGSVAAARLAVLQATTSGYPLYINMGLTHIPDYHMWDLPVSARN